MADRTGPANLMGSGSTLTTGPYASKALCNLSPRMSTGTPVTYAAQAD